MTASAESFSLYNDCLTSLIPFNLNEIPCKVFSTCSSLSWPFLKFGNCSKNCSMDFHGLYQNSFYPFSSRISAFSALKKLWCYSGWGARSKLSWSGKFQQKLDHFELDNTGPFWSHQCMWVWSETDTNVLEPDQEQLRAQLVLIINGFMHNWIWPLTLRVQLGLIINNISAKGFDHKAFGLLIVDNPQ